MKKIIYSLLPIITILLFNVGCSDDVIKEESVVTITVGGIEVDDKEGVIFTKDAQSEVVAVTVDTGEAFTATWSNPGAEKWANITTDATGVKISVEENVSKKARVGLITIITADRLSSKLITVHQNGISVALEVLPGNLKFNQLAGSKTITVNTDAIGKWSISGENEWITVTERTAFNEAIITVTENTTENERVAKLVVTAGGNKKEITIIQTEPLDLIMPFLDFTRYDLEGGNIADSIRKFELERGSHFAGFGRTGSHDYRTLSKNFPEVWYSLDRVDKYIFQIILQPSSWEIIDDPDFRQQIVDNGFEYIYTTELEGKDLFEYHWREEFEEENGHKIGVTLVIDKIRGEVQFFYPFERPVDPGQQEDYPTFETIPYGFSDWTATKADIIAWEEEQGGTLQDETETNPKQLLFKTHKTSPREEFERLYWIDENHTPPQFIQTMLMYKDVSMAYFLSTDGRYYFTREFKKLMTDSGFVLNIVGNDTYYKNSSENKTILVKIVLYDDGSGTKERTLWIVHLKGDAASTGATIKIPNSSMEILK